MTKRKDHRYQTNVLLSNEVPPTHTSPPRPSHRPNAQGIEPSPLTLLIAPHSQTEVNKRHRQQTYSYAPGFTTPHLLKQLSGPQFEPVPTGGILPFTSSLATSCPRAALTSS